MAFTAPKVIPTSWHALFGWILKKRHYSGFHHLEQYGAPNNDWWNPTSSIDWNCWGSILSCVFKLWCITRSNHVLRWKILKSLWSLSWYCTWCDFLKRLNVFKRKWIILKEMEFYTFYTRNWRKINVLIHTAAVLSLFLLWNWKCSKLLPHRSKPPRSFSQGQMPELHVGTTWSCGSSLFSAFYMKQWLWVFAVSLVYYVISCEPTKEWLNLSDWLLVLLLQASSVVQGKKEKV